MACRRGQLDAKQAGTMADFANALLKATMHQRPSSLNLEYFHGMRGDRAVLTRK